MATAETLVTKDFLKGFVKIYRQNVLTKETELIVDKPNMILRGGAKIIAKTLAGDNSSKIWGMYIGYNNTSDFAKPEITVQYGNPFGTLSSDFGYLREPLTFPPSFLSSENYDNNTVLFSTMITSATKVSGADFQDGVSNIYEVALIAAPDSADLTKDTVFSRTNFNQILYDASYNFTITWGVRILVD
jgi:hypothetical protein